MTPEQQESYGRNRIATDPGLQDKVQQSIRAADHMVGSGIGAAIGNDAEMIQSQVTGQPAQEVVTPPKASDIASSAPPSEEIPFSGEEVQASSESATQEADTILGDAQDSTPREQQAASNYKSGVMSIQDAYAQGLIDKSQRDYLIIDEIATFAKNLGRQIGNVGAQFSGGSIDNTEDTSLWSERNAEAQNNQNQMIQEGVVGSPAWRKAQSEMADLDSKELNNKITEIKSRYTEDQLIGMLAQQAAALGMTQTQQKILNKKIKVSDILSGKADNANSEIGQLVYSFLATDALNGFGGTTNAASTIGSFLPW